MTAASNDNDGALVHALNNGDRKAFEFIYRKYVSDLYRYARNNISAKEDCEEVVQEVFEALWARRSNLQVYVSLRAYLLGMVRYKVIGYFKKSALKKKYIEHFLLFEAVYDQVEGEEVNHSAVQSTLERLINELPERCQEALKLRLGEDLSNNDIAERMNISTRTVEAYMFRAFNHIRASYKIYSGQS
jgi:RNA polymerase sigma-70 factor (family 1)